jgi:small-conductance mechanosensitive channel
MDDFGQLFDTMSNALRSFSAEFASIWLPIQIALLLLAAAIAYGGAALIRKHVHFASVVSGWPNVIRQLVLAVTASLPLIIFALVTALMHTTLQEMTAAPARSYLLYVATSLTTAWIVISLLAALLRNHFVNRIVAISAWTIAALSILGLLGNTAKMLDSVALPVGDLRISLLLVLKTTVFLLVTLWLAVVLGNFLDKRIQHTTDLTPSIQILLSKLVRLGLITLAIAIVLHAVGINLSALALFSGAVGVGVGFGLQKIVSNLVSGIILLADKSIKPGDVISVGDNAGWVKTIGARYTLVVLRDGREILVPNEDLVTQRVVNWSHSNDQVRLEVPFGVSYASDPHAVRKVALAAITGIPRILSTPHSSCHFVNFGDSSLDFVLRFWIADPIKGVSNIRSEVRFALWDAFKREGIEIPYPVRDVRFADAARVTVEQAGGKPA